MITRTSSTVDVSDEVHTGATSLCLASRKRFQACIVYRRRLSDLRDSGQGDRGHEEEAFTAGQNIGILKQAGAAVAVAGLCRKNGISGATFYTWRGKLVR